MPKGTTIRVFEFFVSGKRLPGHIAPRSAHFEGNFRDPTCTRQQHFIKESPVTNAKEVAVGNRAEETYCHRTLSFLTELLASR
jgi:hypothetical protein